MADYVEKYNFQLYITVNHKPCTLNCQRCDGSEDSPLEFFVTNENDHSPTYCTCYSTSCYISLGHL